VGSWFAPGGFGQHGPPGSRPGRPFQIASPRTTTVQLSYARSPTTPGGRILPDPALKAARNARAGPPHVDVSAEISQILSASPRRAPSPLTRSLVGATRGSRVGRSQRRAAACVAPSAMREDVEYFMKDRGLNAKHPDVPLIGKRPRAATDLCPRADDSTGSSKVAGQERHEPFLPRHRMCRDAAIVEGASSRDSDGDRGVFDGSRNREVARRVR